MRVRILLSAPAEKVGGQHREDPCNFTFHRPLLLLAVYHTGEALASFVIIPGTFFNGVFASDL